MNATEQALVGTAVRQALSGMPFTGLARLPERLRGEALHRYQRELADAVERKRAYLADNGEPTQAITNWLAKAERRLGLTLDELNAEIRRREEAALAVVAG